MASDPKPRNRRDLEYEIDFYRPILDADAENVEILTALGDLYTRAGRIAEGLSMDERLVRLRPEDPTARYNLACSLALLGRLDEAAKGLRASLVLGFDNLHLLREDPDLENLRRDPRFGPLFERPRDGIPESPGGESHIPG